MTIARGIAVAFPRIGKFLRDVASAIVEAREQRTLIEAQLYRGRYKHSSKLDDDLPIVHH